MTPARAADYLDHMIDAIDRINAYTDRLPREDFFQSSLVQDAVIRNVEIIGEAARNFERAAGDVAAAHQEIPWRLIAGMRNHLLHGYFNVDLDAVWATVRDDLPPLRAALLALIEREAARRLADMGGSDAAATIPARRRPPYG